MKKKITSDPARIWRELASLSVQLVPLTLFQSKTQSRRIRIEKVELKAAEQLVILNKLEQFTPVAGPVIVIHPQHKKATIGFQADLLKDMPDHLVISFPTELFEIERRRFPRFSPEKESSVSFLTQIGQRVKKAKVRDISLEGARISTTFLLNKEDLLPILTFNLHLPYSHMETIITLNDARVARIITLKTGEVEYGLYFKAAGGAKEKLSDYLEMFQQLGSDNTMF